MRFLVDECAGPFLAKWLRERNHEVFSIFDEARGMKDERIIKKAYEEDRIIITLDKDFGEKVYRERYPHKGVILLRLGNERSENKIAVIDRLLKNYGPNLTGRFVVATEKQVRFGMI